MTQIFLILSLTSALPCFAGEEKNSEGISEDKVIPLERVEIAALDSRDKAESFAKTLEGSGYRTIVVTEDKGGRQVYKVFILINEGEQYNIPNYSGEQLHDSAETKPSQDKESSSGSDRKPSWDILGRQNRYVHGSLTLSGIYTDNVLNSRDNKKSDFSTVLSPAIWLTVPHSNENIAPVALSVRSPGGNQLSRQWPDAFFRYQTSLYYRTDIPLTSSSGHLAYGKTPAQTLSGKLLITGSKLSLLAEDHYEYSHHEQEAGTITKPGEQDRYNANYFNIALSYDTRHRLVLSGGYSHFITRYRSDASDFRDRRDDGLFGMLTYKVSPRVSLLAEYRFFGISYDQSSALDSNEHYFLGGISWDITAKSKGLFKAGYGVKDFDHSLGNYQDFSFELQLDHRFTPKTLLIVNAFRKTSETDLAEMAFSLTNGVDARLQHILTSKLMASVGFLYMNDHYKKVHGLTEDADSTTYQESVALQYTFRRWLKGTAGYAYTQKDASLSELQYNSNTFYFNVITSL